MKTTAFLSFNLPAKIGWLPAAVLLASYLLLAESASAQTLPFTAWVAEGAGDWDDPANWSAGVPSYSTGIVYAEISNGGTAELRLAFDAFTPNMHLGSPAGSGTLEVSRGPGIYELLVDFYLLVGDGGTGALNILNGGEVRAKFGVVGSAGGQGAALVDGGGWRNSELSVGDAGTGALSIQNGGRVYSELGNIGAVTSSQGTVTVDGANSTWTNAFDLAVGNDGTGALSITRGGQVSNNNASLGVSSGSIGVATVDGPDSVWTNRAALKVGGTGGGALSIQNGGKVFSASGNIGAVTGSQGTVSVDAANSTWRNTQLTVGGAGVGTLSITGGGLVSNGNATIGASSGSSGAVTVDGPSSVWNNNGDLAVGDSGAGTLDITGGGVVTSTNGRIGGKVGSSGTVLIDGPGSIWHSSGNFLMGGIEGGVTGTLSIQNGGVLSAVGGMFITPLNTVRGDGTIVGHVINYGTVTPGTPTGTLRTIGDYTPEGTLQIELASPTSFDKLAVTGNIKPTNDIIGGRLEVSLAGGYVPHGSQSFNILDWGGAFRGTFLSILLPTLDGTLEWDTSQLYDTGVLSVVGPAPTFFEADFDENGAVDGADLTKWKAGFGTGATHLQGDADGDADVDGDDFLVWQRQLGNPPTVMSGNQVPEPIAIVLASLAGWGLALLRRRRRQAAGQRAAR